MPGANPDTEHVAPTPVPNVGNDGDPESTALLDPYPVVVPHSHVTAVTGTPLAVTAPFNVADEEVTDDAAATDTDGTRPVATVTVCSEDETAL